MRDLKSRLLCIEGSAIKFSRCLRLTSPRAPDFFGQILAFPRLTAVHLAWSFDQMDLGLEQVICFICFGQCYIRDQVSMHMVRRSSHHSVCYSHANFCTSIFQISRSIAISLSAWCGGHRTILCVILMLTSVLAYFKSVAVLPFL
jgi:hypothetical protein